MQTLLTDTRQHPRAMELNIYSNFYKTEDEGLKNSGNSAEYDSNIRCNYSSWTKK